MGDYGSDSEGRPDSVGGCDADSTSHCVGHSDSDPDSDSPKGSNLDAVGDSVGDSESGSESDPMGDLDSDSDSALACHSDSYYLGSHSVSVVHLFGIPVQIHRAMNSGSDSGGVSTDSHIFVRSRRFGSGSKFGFDVPFGFWFIFWAQL